MKGFVYILELSNGNHYIGSSRDVDKRVKKHNNGGVKSTKRYRPVKLLFVREYSEYAEALKVELKLKKMKSRKSTEQFMHDLASG